MSPSEVRALAEMGHSIGCHSHRHRLLSRMAPQACDHDLATNISAIRQATGKHPTWISFPYGKKDTSTDTVLNTCYSHGIEWGFTMNRGFIRPGANRIALDRVDCNDAPGGKSPIVSW